VRDFKSFMNAAAVGKKVLKDNAVTGIGLPTMGTQVLMNVINEVGAMPTRNMREVQFEGASKISAEAMHEPRESDGKPNLVTNAACFGCTIACGRISTIDPAALHDQQQARIQGRVRRPRIRGGVGARLRYRAWMTSTR
jgi:aldehyde:ferredoxin oxidoreductase